MDNVEQQFASLREFIAGLPVKRHVGGCACGAIRTIPSPPAEIAAEIGNKTLAFSAPDACQGVHSTVGCFYPDHKTANELGGEGPGWYYDNDGKCHRADDIAFAMACAFPGGPSTVEFILAPNGINSIGRK